MNRIVAERRFNVFAKKALRLLGRGGASTAVFLFEGSELAKLKERYTGKKPKKVVDVLAFSEPKGFPHPETKNRFVGEVYINKKIAFSDVERTELLVVHGLLHLLGYTHDKKGDTIKMERKEVWLLSKISNDKLT